MKPVSNEKLLEYSQLYYRDLCDQEAWWDVAEDIKAMATELMERRKSDVNLHPHPDREQPVTPVIPAELVSPVYGWARSAH